LLNINELVDQSQFGNLIKPAITPDFILKKLNGFIQQVVTDPTGKVTIIGLLKLLSRMISK
jgi:hypothetical protein